MDNGKIAMMPTELRTIQDTITDQSASVAKKIDAGPTAPETTADARAAASRKPSSRNRCTPGGGSAPKPHQPGTQRLTSTPNTSAWTTIASARPNATPPEDPIR